jgi:hypothetical protein
MLLRQARIKKFGEALPSLAIFLLISSLHLWACCARLLLSISIVLVTLSAFTNPASGLEEGLGIYAST